MANIGRQLEQYTEQHPQEVLLVTIEVLGEPDQLLVFRGQTSSLMRSTSFDPDIPVCPDGAVVLAVDRLQAPYQPQAPYYIERNVSWETMQTRLPSC
jgi:hypothetical protein